MLDWESYGESFARICEEWDRAEEDIKLAEQVCHKVVFPSVKELRYAGRRIVEALNQLSTDDSAEADKKIKSLLQDAEFDCHRARHDAIDAATAKIALDIDIAVKKLGYSSILTPYPEFPNLKNELSKVRKKIKASRRNRDNREAIYSVIEAADFGDIVELFVGFKNAEPIMLGLAKKQRAHLLIGYAIGVMGLILAIISVLTALLS